MLLDISDTSGLGDFFYSVFLTLYAFGIDLSKLGDVLSYDPRNPMIFCSGLFLFLFLFFSLIYNLLNKKDTLRIAFVTLFSYYFYYKSSGAYFVLLAIVTLVDYNIGRKLYKTTGLSSRKLLMFISVVVNLGLLCYFKYTNFLYQAFCPLWGGHFSPFDIMLPVGISFFTFQSMSYTIDIYRNKLQPVDRLIDYAFFVSFFPQLVAGPIVRASDFIPQIRKPLFVSREMFGTALFLIVAGLIKKSIISDYISVNYVDRIFDNPGLYSGVENLLGVYGYTLQIYCDFSGYSDMAIGIALLLGFHFPKNFDSPYKSQSVTEFWKRWHISLSSWLQDYLYISLGGNRKGKIRQYFNLMMTMLLGGLWHGANWNFILWGGLHGFALCVHKIWMKIRNHKKGYKNPWPVRIWATIVTFHFACFCWIFFRASSLESVEALFNKLIYEFNGAVLPQVVAGYPLVFAFLVLGYLLHFCPESWSTACRNLMVRMPLVLQVAVITLVVWLMLQVKGSDVVPFIYFQF